MSRASELVASERKASLAPPAIINVPAPARITPLYAGLPPAGGELLAVRARRARVAIIALAVAVLAASVLAGGLGALHISPAQVVAILADRIGWHLSTAYEPQQATVFWLLRVPRVLLALLIGAGLALCGGSMQGLFRNPLADPALIGISSGAALGAVVSIVAVAHLSAFGTFSTLPFCAFVGGLLATVAVHSLGRVDGRTSVTHLLLAGIAVNAFCGAGVGLVTFQASDAQLRSITFWSLGSLGGASWRTCALLAPLIILPGWLLGRQARLLNALLLGEAEAGHLGFRVELGKRLILVCVAVVVGAAVSTAGIIGFVGLVAPHLVRLVLGPDHRWLLPAGGLLGALLLLMADTLCRTAAAPAEIPVGVVTALLGAPFFLWLLWRERRSI